MGSYLDTLAIVSDEDIMKLSHLFSENLLVAALDLIDRDRGSSPNLFSPFENTKTSLSPPVICLKLPWVRPFFEVQGSTATYSVQVNLPRRMPVFCSCPAFAFSVLLSEDHLLVRHPTLDIFQTC